LVLHEIGRGTSTYDGLSIAWAVVEHISDAKKLGAKTLFATHYHELTELEGRLNSVNNYCIAVKEQGEDIIFLRKIIKGGADKSYGIQVAKLAGVPEDVLHRAYEIADQLTENDINAAGISVATKDLLNTVEVKHSKKSGKANTPGQLSLFGEPLEDYSEIINEIKSMDISQMTPMNAMNKLYELQEMLKK
jgi:DNA mismatch repair protein MutS